MLQGNVKTFHAIFKKMGEESTRAVELALEVIVCLFLDKNTILNFNSPKAASDLKIIDHFSFRSFQILSGA